MTFLDKAKREAKRLFKLASDTNNTISIDTLSQAQKIVAHMNGYHSWHDFEENLKRKEFIGQHFEHAKPTTIELSDMAIETYCQTQPWLNHKFKKQTQEIALVEWDYLKNRAIGTDFNHINCDFSSYETGTIKKTKHIVHYDWPHKAIFSDDKTIRMPQLFSATLSYLKDKRGCIYTDASEAKIFLYFHVRLTKFKREDDLFYLNFMDRTEVQSHTIDLINPLIHHKEFFLQAFHLENSTFADTFYALCWDLSQQGILIEAQHLKSFLSILWLQSDKHLNNIHFNSDTEKKIQHYLNFCGFYEPVTEDNMNEEHFQRHHSHVAQALKVIEMIDFYEKKHVLSATPQINLESIFTLNQVLVVNFPDITRPDNYAPQLTRLFYLNLFMSQDKYQTRIDGKVAQEYAMGLCMFDRAEYCFDNITLPLLHKGLKNRHYHYSLGIEKASLFNSSDKNYIFSAINEYIFLKYNNPSEIPHIVQARINYLVEKPINLFNEKNKILSNLHYSQGYLVHNEHFYEKNKIYNFSRTSLYRQKYNMRAINLKNVYGYSLHDVQNAKLYPHPIIN